MRAMADHLMQYWDDLGIDKEPDSLIRFWKSFGYLSARWRDPPSVEEKYARRRCCSVSICVQCGNQIFLLGLIFLDECISPFTLIVHSPFSL